MRGTVLYIKVFVQVEILIAKKLQLGITAPSASPWASRRRKNGPRAKARERGAASIIRAKF